MSDVKLPRWLRIFLALTKNYKNTIGSFGILLTLYLWYFDAVTKEKAIFGIILLMAGGFLNADNLDLISFFKYLSNYKKGGQNEPESNA